MQRLATWMRMADGDAPWCLVVIVMVPMWRLCSYQLPLPRKVRTHAQNQVCREVRGRQELEYTLFILLE
jgi:hypothetical protein